MDIKGANPFLFGEDDYSSPNNTVNSNPFLMGEDDCIDTAGNDNPFLSQTATTVSSNSNSTNPFAFDPMDLEPQEAQPAEIQTNAFITSTNNQFIDTASLQDGNIFSINNTVTNDFLSNTTANIPNIIPEKPTELNLKYTNTVGNDDRQHSMMAGPPRPPPPRPPPSKETQDLLMSVMGAMDATSSHLLDRIPPTRTPSPVSMRDLHSPSPTPEPFADFLDVGDNKPPSTNIISKPTTDDLMSVNQDACDINQNPPLIAQTKSSPPRPLPPVRPPRPQPPQKPPPPRFTTQTSPPKPPPSAVETKPEIPQQQYLLQEEPLQQQIQQQQEPMQQQRQPQQGHEMMDLFGMEEKPSQKVIASTADILSLYNAPVVTQPAVTDLLSDTVETTMATEAINSTLIGNNETVSDITSTIFGDNTIDLSLSNPLSDVNSDTYVATPIVQDNFISPEPSQTDLQMDTSDSQSKGSVSSVTFNPFATADDNAVTSPKQNDVFQPEKTGNMLDNSSYQETNIFESDAETMPENQIFQEHTSDIFMSTTTTTAVTSQLNEQPIDNFGITNKEPASDAFDAFAAKFESVGAKDENKNGFIATFPNTGDAWGNQTNAFNDSLSGFNEPNTTSGFGADESFDAFLAMQEPPAVPQSTPNRFNKVGSLDSDDDKDFSVVIRPKSNTDDVFSGGVLPVLAPPPAVSQNAFNDSSPRFNPFDQQTNEYVAAIPVTETASPFGMPEMKRTDSQETPPTPLFDDDVSQPLEDFPRVYYTGDGWEMHLRQPNKKKITGQRFWKKIFVKLLHQSDCVLLQLFNLQNDKDPFQELPLQPCYSVSDIGAQQYDNFGKIFTVKLQYIFYKERPGVRPGQVKKAERITNKLSQFAAYAIQGDYQGVKEFGSDLKKLGLPVEHAPQVSQLMKLGSLNYEDLKQFSMCIEEALFKLQAHRDRALQYKMEEVQITAVDELYVEQDAEGHVDKQIARVRLFFLGFLTGMPDVELGANDMRRQGKEVVGRHDIIPVVTEEWIRLENVEFHSCVQQDEYNDTHIIKFKPPDACYIELLRFRIRPPKNRELPLQLKATICITGTRVELRADVLVPGFASRKLGQVPCEDVMIRFPIPECWIYLFRVEKHFRYGSVKSAHRRTGKIKGIERILGTVDTLQESLIEVTSGQAKYEHQHRAIVWRCPRLPKEGQGAYTTHNMVCRLALTSYDQVPEQLAEYCYVEFTMPATQVSHTTVRSVSLQNSDSDDPPEKYVRYLARHEYRVGIEKAEGEGPAAYVAATYTKPQPVQEEKPKAIPEAESSSDSE